MGKIFAFFFAVVFIITGIGIIHQYKMSRRMINADGTLNEIHYTLSFGAGKPRGRSYYVFADYEYLVENKLLKGSHLKIDGDAYGLESNAKQVVDFLKKSKNVTVWYDPLKPSYSFLLKPEITTNTVLYFTGSMILCYLSYRYFDNFLMWLIKKGKSLKNKSD